MLKIDPKLRPTAKELSNSSTILSKSEELFGQSFSDKKMSFLRLSDSQVIQCSSHIDYLTQNIRPIFAEILFWIK